MVAVDNSGAAGVDRLRHDIDRGLGGDKVRVTDPAAAPLGTGAVHVGVIALRVTAFVVGVRFL